MAVNPTSENRGEGEAAQPDGAGETRPATAADLGPPDKKKKKNEPTAYVILEDAEFDFATDELQQAVEAQLGNTKLVIEHPFRITAKGSQVARRSAYERLRDERAETVEGGEKVPGKVGKLRAVPVISYKGSHWREEQTTMEVAEHD